MSKAKKLAKEAGQYIDDHVVDPLTDGTVTKKMNEYASDMKRMAKEGVDDINDGMMELGDNIANTIDAFKNHQEVERLQDDLKNGLNKLGKSAKKVVNDVKDIADE